MLIPHNFLDRDASRESVQGVRLNLKGHRDSGGLRGMADADEPGDLRSRGEGEKKRHEAKYFGGKYEEGLKVPLELLEPELEAVYVSGEHETSHLSLNGSAAGVWMED